MPPVSRRQFVSFLLIVLYVVCATRAEADDPTLRASLYADLEARVLHEPDNANSWRMLGRFHSRDGEWQIARKALKIAVELDPESAAAHFDFAQVLLEMGESEQAVRHLKTASAIAPGSRYADKAALLLNDLEPFDEQDAVIPAGFEVKRFDGTDLLDEHHDEPLADELPQRKRLFARLETGILYNTNVALAPISRGLSSGTRESFQWFLSPEIEYSLVNDGEWRAGPAFLGYFNVNLDDFQELNLQSYQPSFFVERLTDPGWAPVLYRLQYQFTHDQFDWTPFGDRHALTGQSTILWNDGSDTTAYVAVNLSEFRDDGALPAATSQDGWTTSVGLSHTLFPQMPYLSLLRGGIELSHADIEGTDYKFNGIALNSSAHVPIVDNLRLELDSGWGYRDYPDFTLTPSRNENIIQAAARLRRHVTELWSVALVFNYDRFLTKNDLFDSQRYTAGAVTTIEF